MRFLIEHETHLDFPAPVREQFCELRLLPLNDSFQSVRSFDVAVEPAGPLRTYTDTFGNTVHHFEVLGAHTQLRTRATSIVDTFLENPFDYPLHEPADERRWMAEALVQDPGLWQYVLFQSPSVPTLNQLGLTGALPQWGADEPVQKSVWRAMEWTASQLHYESGSSDTHASLHDVLQSKRGVCQDFAHLFISVIRSWRLPARYVMGYTHIRNGEDDVRPLATHAWADVWMPGVGWRGFDVTHGLAANDYYIRVAVGRHSPDAAPQRGTYKGNFVSSSPQVKLVLSQTQEQANVLVGAGPSPHSNDQ